MDLRENILRILREELGEYSRSLKNARKQGSGVRFPKTAIKYNPLRFRPYSRETVEDKDPKVGTEKKPEGSSRRLYRQINLPSQDSIREMKKRQVIIITEEQFNKLFESNENIHVLSYNDEFGSVENTSFDAYGLLNEAEYQGRKVKLGKIMQGDIKKSKVYVKNDKGKVVKVNFGFGGKSAKGKRMVIKKNNPKRRKSFRARHNCSNPGPRWKPRYWACKTW